MAVAKTVKFKDSYFLKAHKLAQEGHSQRDIAACLGVSWGQFSKWLRLKPALRQAIEQAKTPAKSGKSSHNRALAPTGTSFVEYAYGRLPAKLQELWDRLEPFADRDAKQSPDVAAKIDALFDRSGVRNARMHLWFHALIRTNWNANEACRICNISRTAVDKWFKEEPDFRYMVQVELPRMKKDFAEAALWRLVASGDSSCVQFANRCLNPETYNPPKNHVVKGEVAHTSPDLTAVLASLPIDHRRAVLEAMRKVREGGIKALPEAEIVASRPAASL